jgi:tetratricopeptide (TPR) repeat protein
VPNAKHIVDLPFKKYKYHEKDYDDGLGYYNYLIIFDGNRTRSEKALRIRQCLENLIYVYYVREQITWPAELPPNADSPAYRFNYLTPTGFKFKNRKYISLPKYWLPKHIVKYDDSIINSFLTIRKIVNQPIHTGDNYSVTDDEIDSAIVLLERIITWYFDRYKIDIKTFRSTLERMHSGDQKKIVDSGCIHINQQYWTDLGSACIRDKNNIRQNFFLRTDETLTHKMLAIKLCESNRYPTPPERIIEVTHKGEEEKRSEKLHELIDKLFSINCSVLVKVFAPSGEGKTVFLNHITLAYSFLQDKCKVYYIKNITDDTINFIRSEITATILPLLFILDTPSKQAIDILNHNFSVVREFSYKPFLMIVADQENRFNHRLSGKAWEDKFENYFSEVYKIDFELTPSERENIFKAIIQTIQQTETFGNEKEITIKGIYNSDPKLTIRERINKIVTYLKANITPRDTQEKDVWEEITKDSATLKFRDIFAFVASFYFYGDGASVPVAIFNCGYLPLVTESDVESFITSQSNTAIIKINNGNLELRHDRIAEWFFEFPENINKGVRILKKFVSHFEKEMDPIGCYLFRNIHHSMEKLEIFGGFTKSDSKRILSKYFAVVGFADPACPKVLTELAKLEEEIPDKIHWLNKTIEHNECDVHARTFKVQLLLRIENYNDAQLLLNDLFRISGNASWTLNYQFELDKRLNNEFSAEKYISLAQYKTDYYNALYLVAKRMQKVQATIPVALEILTYLKEKEPDKPFASMIIASIYGRQQSRSGNELAIKELLSVLDKNEKYVPARLLLAEMYIRNGDLTKAENILVEGIDITPDQPSLYVRLVRMYRENKTLIKGAIEKTEKIFSKGLEEQSFGLGIQIRTEYAKWCFENFDTKEKHQTAITINNDTIKLFPLHIHSRTELGIIYQTSRFFKDLNTSITILREAIAIDAKDKEVPSRVVLAKSLMLLNTQSSWIEAKEILEKAKLINPKNFPTYLELIKVYQHFNDIPKLIDSIKAAEETGEVDGKLFTVQAQELLKKGEINQALILLEKALEKDRDNFYFLTQIASILLKYALKEKVKNHNIITSIQRTNSLLFAAEDYLIRSLNIYPKNERALLLLVFVYDALQFRKGDLGKHYNVIRLRNQALQELYHLNHLNPYLILALCKIFVLCWKPRLAIYFFEQWKSNNSTIELKLKYLIQRKEVYKLFNDVEEMKKIENEFNQITRGKEGLEKFVYVFNKYGFNERDNYKLLQIFNKGYIDPSYEFIESDGQIFSIVKKGQKIHNQIQGRDKVFFATYLIDNTIYANNIEPYFEISSSINLIDILPYKLNALGSSKHYTYSL